MNLIRVIFCLIKNKNKSLPLKEAEVGAVGNTVQLGKMAHKVSHKGTIFLNMRRADLILPPFVLAQYLSWVMRYAPTWHLTWPDKDNCKVESKSSCQNNPQH